MLIIRKEQLEQFERDAFRRFEDDMVSHLKDFAPHHFGIIGDGGTRDVIRLGAARAANYGFTNRGPVRFYIELMFMLGSYFDTDPTLPWAREVLCDTLVIDQMERADLLHEHLLLYLQKVAGPENQYIIKALQRMRGVTSEAVLATGGDFEETMLSHMRSVHPERCDHVGERPLKFLIQWAVAASNRSAIGTQRGRVLFVALMFAMGHGFANDPLFPWVRRTINDPRVADADKRAERLERKGLVYLERVLANLGQG